VISVRSTPTCRGFSLSSISTSGSAIREKFGQISFGDFGFRRWDLNQQLCRRCFHRVDSHSGGAEIPVSLLYVDVRGSTELAESLSPSEFTEALNGF